MNVAVLMGSKSDWPVMQKVVNALTMFGVSYQVRVMSAHRTPDALREFVKNSDAMVFICGAGGAAHLPGMTASWTTAPVIGVPISCTALSGIDALYSIVQMPAGVPVATVAVDGAFNAAILAVEMMSIGDSELKKKLLSYRKENEDKVFADDKKIKAEA
jgi:5-(carboxyamino)imidazole ribonucleotide mutase